MKDQNFVPNPFQAERIVTSIKTHYYKNKF
jgi:hypothetical protein